MNRIAVLMLVAGLAFLKTDCSAEIAGNNAPITYHDVWGNLVTVNLFEMVERENLPDLKASLGYLMAEFNRLHALDPENAQIWAGKTAVSVRVVRDFYSSKLEKLEKQILFAPDAASTSVDAATAQAQKQTRAQLQTVSLYLKEEELTKTLAALVSRQYPEKRPRDSWPNHDSGAGDQY